MTEKTNMAYMAGLADIGSTLPSLPSAKRATPANTRHTPTLSRAGKHPPSLPRSPGRVLVSTSKRRATAHRFIQPAALTPASIDAGSRGRCPCAVPARGLFRGGCAMHALKPAGCASPSVQGLSHRGGDPVPPLRPRPARPARSAARVRVPWLREAGVLSVELFRLGAALEAALSRRRQREASRYRRAAFAAREQLGRIEDRLTELARSLPKPSLADRLAAGG